MTLPDWQLPQGVDRGLWDYLHSGEMVGGYDAQIGDSPLARVDVLYCAQAFPTPGRLVDLGCGTGRLANYFAAKGYDCLGVDLSDEMLARAMENANAANAQTQWLNANLVDLSEVESASFDYAACLFSTLGMVRGGENRVAVVANAFRLLKPGGRLVLHVHNRFFGGLGGSRVLRYWWRGLLRRPDAGDTTMSQAYGGAPLTLHHFTKRESFQLLTDAGFVVREVRPIGLRGEAVGKSWHTYGYLLLAERPKE